MFPMNTVPAAGILFITRNNRIVMVIENDTAFGFGGMSYYTIENDTAFGGMSYYTTETEITEFLYLANITEDMVLEADRIDYDSDRNIDIYFMEY